ncbi:MAG: hypothetical protein PHD11_07960 [Bacteroidales bacterium]|nr:hypothetical protein [Bacteroidales bacterium]MDD4671113.1 hypothetical protein [Bacteroidales bacterium]
MFIFNIDHDLCIANGDSHFVPPDSALKFAEDCRDVALWMKGLEDDRDKIIPWGWNRVLKCNLIKQGFPENMLPDDAQLALIRSLSHRTVSIEALKFVISHLPDYLWPSPQMAVSRVEEVSDAVSLFDRAVLKSPWSGSGKGLRWVDRQLSQSDAGWCRNVIAKQGCVIVEPRYEVVQDCAMLFRCGDSIDFIGYSLFETENGVYRGNLLVSDRYIEEQLCRYVPKKQLLDVKNELIRFIESHFQGKYSGYIGVDQFIFRENGEYFFHPAVEINVRMTMGLIARHLFDYYPQFSENEGTMQMKVEYRPKQGELQKEFGNAVTLCPLTHSSEYGIIIEEISR